MLPNPGFRMDSPGAYGAGCHTARVNLQSPIRGLPHPASQLQKQVAAHKYMTTLPGRYLSLNRQLYVINKSL
jgi:hypothetical protein